ncbi:MAG: hypothetical protein ABJM26_10770 [Anderseniella sp.]|uniref:hypothetical protein n=1 Tax=Parasphingorhabdus sp. TaxID=2709688 RepID=UPI0032927F06
MSRAKSPKYPYYSLSKAIENARKVYDADRVAMLPREVIAKHLGYSGLSGASDTAIATLVQYNLLDRIGKGEMRVSQLAVDILAPENESQKQSAINRAALSPPLFSEIWNHFDGRVPSEEALKIYLLRREFHDRAIPPVMKAFAPTMAMLKQQNETESGGNPVENNEESDASPVEDEAVGTSASIGDYIQWESQGALQFKEPQRVRWVSEDRDWLAVEGSSAGIPMSEITIEQPSAKLPPIIPPIANADPAVKREAGFTEWFRVKVGADKLITINYKGADDIGPREIQKMIAILEAQKLALED